MKKAVKFSGKLEKIYGADEGSSQIFEKLENIYGTDEGSSKIFWKVGKNI